MNDTPADTQPNPQKKPAPIYRLEPAERYAHFVRRMAERGGPTWTVEQAAHLEGRISFVIAQLAQGKPVAPILPKLLFTEKDGSIQYWRFLLAGQPHTAVWSTWAKGLISYVGPGELLSKQ